MLNGYTYCKTLCFEWIEQRRVQKTLWTHLPFKEKDKALLKAYKGVSPYHICRDFLRNQGAKEIHSYGETPLTTLARLARDGKITRADHLIELGAGRGRGALFFSSFLGCSVTAFEMIPHFAETLKRLAPPNLSISCSNYHTADLSSATVIYLYGTLLSDEQINALIPKFPVRAKIFTVSFPLSDYTEAYQTKQILTGSFPWGKTEIYWNERIES